MTLRSDLRIDPATEADVPVILALIKALADYERMAGEVVADEAPCGRRCSARRRPPKP